MLRRQNTVENTIPLTTTFVNRMNKRHLPPHQQLPGQLSQLSQPVLQHQASLAGIRRQNPETGDFYRRKASSEVLNLRVGTQNWAVKPFRAGCKRGTEVTQKIVRGDPLY